MNFVDKNKNIPFSEQLDVEATSVVMVALFSVKPEDADNLW
jgi:hypothetical protein